jgi:hypothetical protein
LAGRKTGRYKPNSPFWYSGKEKWGILNSYKTPSIPVVRPLRPRYEENDDEEPQQSKIAKKIREVQSLLHKHSRSFNQPPILRDILAYSSSREDDSILDELGPIQMNAPNVEQDRYKSQVKYS